MTDILKSATHITISYESLTDLLTRTTNNPLAEAEVPELLREAIRRGITVEVSVPTDSRSFRLVLNGDKFGFEPLCARVRVLRHC